MKSLIFPLAALVAVTTPALAQERTAGRSYDAQVNWAALQNGINQVSSQNKVLAGIIDKMQACNATRKIYAPADPDKDADGCVAVGGKQTQVGTATDTSSWKNRIVSVTFPKPFTAAPNVYLAAQNYYYWGGCDNNVVAFDLEPLNVTSTGFQVSFPSYKDGCNSPQLRGVTWIAVEK